MPNIVDSREHEFLSRVARHGPKIVSLALAVLLMLEISRMALALTGSREGFHAPRPPAARRAAPPTVDVRRIAMAHLFGTAIDPTTADPDNLNPSTANLVLDGTIATNDPKHGIAIVHAAGPSKVYSVGDDVEGASLHSVYLDHVLLDRGGTLEILQLPRVRAIRARQNIYVDSSNRVVDKPPSALDKLMHAVGSYDGKPRTFRGYRVYPQGDGKGFRTLGFVPGDLVTAVNGMPIDENQPILDTIGASDQVSVTVERQGQTVDVALDIAGAVNELTTSYLAGGGGAPAGAGGGATR